MSLRMSRPLQLNRSKERCHRFCKCYPWGSNYYIGLKKPLCIKLRAACHSLSSAMAFCAVMGQEGFLQQKMRHRTHLSSDGFSRNSGLTEQRGENQGISRKARKMSHISYITPSLWGWATLDRSMQCHRLARGGAIRV